MSTLQHVAVFTFLFFLPIGKGVFCNLLLFNNSSVHCISYTSAGNFVLMLLTVADLVKLKSRICKFSLLFHSTSAFVSILFGWRLSASISINAIQLSCMTQKPQKKIMVSSLTQQFLDCFTFCFVFGLIKKVCQRLHAKVFLVNYLKNLVKSSTQQFLNWFQLVRARTMAPNTVL